MQERANRWAKMKKRMAALFVPPMVAIIATLFAVAAVRVAAQWVLLHHGPEYEITAWLFFGFAQLLEVSTVLLVPFIVMWEISYTWDDWSQY